MADSHLVEAKRRLMFVKGEDFYFMTYNTLILLYELGCTSRMKPFKDHRRIAFLLDFIADPRLVEIVRRHQEVGGALNSRDRQELVRAYSDGAARVHLTTRLVCALEVHGLMSIHRDPDAVAANIVLSSDAVPASFWSSELYAQERENVATLQVLLPRVRTTTLNATLKWLFVERGVPVWHG